MIKTYCLRILFIALTAQSYAQVNEEDLVNEVIVRLFDGMQKGDSAQVHSCFADVVTMHSVYANKQGKPVLKAGDLNGFLVAVGTPHDEVWNEQITKTEILIDANMAHVWTDYTLYLGDQLSHCGVNSFQLAKLNQGWKIVNLMDTRRREGCDE